MTDKRFHDVVDSQVIVGPDGQYAKGICKTCSEQHRVGWDEFENDNLLSLKFTDDGYETEPMQPLSRVDEPAEVLRFVAQMRAWHCCHDDEPLDGFPEEVEPPSTVEWKR